MRINVIVFEHKFEKKDLTIITLVNERGWTGCAACDFELKPQADIHSSIIQTKISHHALNDFGFLA